MAKHIIYRKSEEHHTVLLSSEQVAAMLKASGYVPQHVHTFEIQVEIDSDGGAAVKWVDVTSATEERDT